MIRTGYSFKKTYGHLDDVMARLKAVGYEAAPIADFCSTFGFVRWDKLCRKSGIKPVFGVELPVSASVGDKKPIVDHWTFIAKDSLKPLHDLIGQATLGRNKEPILTYAEAQNAAGLFKIAGHTARLDEMEPADDLFVGLSPAVNKGFFRTAFEAGFSFLAKSDNFYPTQEDKEAYRVTLGRRAHTQTYPQWILSESEWNDALSWVGEDECSNAWENFRGVLAASNAKLIKSNLPKTEKTKTLRELCEEGARKLSCDISNPVYAERLEREIRMIEEKGFTDYIFIIADMVNWAKSRMVVGPARGSSCGSLVCYLTGITSVDPIPYGLIFERFVDVNRNDLPDIDIDFSDDRRDAVFAYAEAKYGNSFVGRLGTVGVFRARSTLNQIGAGLNIPKWLVGKVADNAIEYADGDDRVYDTLEDTFKETSDGRKLIAEYPEAIIATKIEGHPNTDSQHAAGIVISDRPLTEYVAINNAHRSIMCDKKDAEALNLLKIDALGLKQLSIFERCLELIGKPDISGELEKIPLNDPKAFQVINDGYYSGIFQFDGNALKALTKQVIVGDLEDFIALTSLARPGPMASGGAAEWVKRKNGAPVSYYHPCFEPILKDTLGIIIYQEQVMRIGREIGDMTWAEVTDLRRAIGKKLGAAQMASFKEKWAKGALAKGVPPSMIDKVWSDICTFGAYGFNRSHAVAYSIVSYWCCWLKAYHPVEFAAATLDAKKEPIKQIQILRELKEEGIDYIPVDPDFSGAKWEIKEEDGRQILVGPLTQIKGIGPVAVKDIIDSRNGDKEISKARRALLESAKTEIDTLYPIENAVSQMYPDLRDVNIYTPPTRISDVQCGKTRGDVVIIGVVKRANVKQENSEDSIRQRGKRVDGPDIALNMFVSDDHDEIFVKVGRYDFDRMGQPILDQVRPGKSIYAFKGVCPQGFRMISVKAAKYLGEIEDAQATYRLEQQEE